WLAVLRSPTRPLLTQRNALPISMAITATALCAVEVLGHGVGLKLCGARLWPIGGENAAARPSGGVTRTGSASVRDGSRHRRGPGQVRSPKSVPPCGPSATHQG